MGEGDTWAKAIPKKHHICKIFRNKEKKINLFIKEKL